MLIHCLIEKRDIILISRPFTHNDDAALGRGCAREAGGAAAGATIGRLDVGLAEPGRQTFAVENVAAVGTEDGFGFRIPVLVADGASVVSLGWRDERAGSEVFLL